MKDNVVFQDRAWLAADELTSVRAQLVEHVYGDEHAPDYSASFYLAEEGVGHFCFSVGHEDEPADLRRVRDAASVVSGMLAALVAAIDRLTTEKGEAP